MKMSNTREQKPGWVTEIGWFFIISSAAQIWGIGHVLLTVYGFSEEPPSLFINNPNLRYLVWLALVYEGYILFTATRFIDLRWSSRTQLEGICWYTAVSGLIICILRLLRWSPLSLGAILAGGVRFFWR